MPTPANSRFTVPNYRPETPEQHFENWRAVERMVNNLPFPQVQIYEVAYDPPFEEIAPTVGVLFELYPIGELPDGWVIPQRGTIIATINLDFDTDTTAGNRAITVGQGNDLTITYGYGQVVPDANSTPSRLNWMIQAYHFHDNSIDMHWKPTLEIRAPLAGTSIFLHAIFCTFTLYPDGLWNRFAPINADVTSTFPDSPS